MDRTNIPPEAACGWCEGKGFVGRIDYYPTYRGQLIRHGAASFLRIGPDVLRVMGTVEDMPCGQCNGTGREPVRRGILIPTTE